jgi:hypothetical protein
VVIAGRCTYVVSVHTLFSTADTVATEAWYCCLYELPDAHPRDISARPACLPKEWHMTATPGGLTPERLLFILAQDVADSLFQAV